MRISWRPTAEGSAASCSSPSASPESGRPTSTKAFCRKTCKNPNSFRNSRNRRESRNAFRCYVFFLIVFGFCFRSTKRFGPNGERFEQLAFLNLAQSVVCLVWSFISKSLSRISDKCVKIFYLNLCFMRCCSKTCWKFRVYYFLKPSSYGNLWLSYSIYIFCILWVYLNQIRLTFYFNHFFMCSVIKIWSSGNSGGAPWWSYWSAGITNTIGPAMGIEALKYISYPAQVWFLHHLFFPHLFYLKVIKICKSISVLCTKIHSSFLKIKEITILQIKIKWMVTYTSYPYHASRLKQYIYASWCICGEFIVQSFSVFGTRLYDLFNGWWFFYLQVLAKSSKMIPGQYIVLDWQKLAF